MLQNSLPIGNNSVSVSLSHHLVCIRMGTHRVSLYLPLPLKSTVDTGLEMNCFGLSTNYYNLPFSHLLLTALTVSGHGMNRESYKYGMERKDQRKEGEGQRGISGTVPDERRFASKSE